MGIKAFVHVQVYILKGRIPIKNTWQVGEILLEVNSSLRASWSGQELTR